MVSCKTKMSFPWYLVVKTETVNKGGARWWRKGKIDQRPRGAHFKISRHEDLKAHVLEPRLIGQRARRYVEVDDRHPRAADALNEGQ